MVPTPYDPYNSPMDGRLDLRGEPQIILFPFSSAANSKILAVHRKIRQDSHNKQPIDDSPAPEVPSSSKKTSSKDDIAELKRRLQEIKAKRARQRDRTLEGEQSQEGVQANNKPSKDDATQPSFNVDSRSQPSRNQIPTRLSVGSLRNESSLEGQCNPNDASLPTSFHFDAEPTSELSTTEIPLPLRRPSLTFETATETLDTSFGSSSRIGSTFNPKRLLCSSYKAIEEAKNLEPKGPSAPPTLTATKRETSSRAISNHDFHHDRERVMNVVDSLLCFRPGKGDPLDLIICSSPPTEDTIVTSSESLTTGYTGTFDPYYSTGSFSSSLPKRMGKLDRGVGSTLTGGSSSVFLEYESTSLGDGVSNKSCTSSAKRSPPAWYQRPDSINTSEIKQQVMEMVFYANNPNEPFDCHGRLSETLFY